MGPRQGPNQAALGLLWTSLVNERIQLRKSGRAGCEAKRKMAIEMSSFIRKCDIDFEIVPQGLQGIH